MCCKGVQNWICSILEETNRIYLLRRADGAKGRIRDRTGSVRGKVALDTQDFNFICPLKDIFNYSVITSY